MQSQSMRGLVVSSAALGKQWTPWFAIHRMQSAAIQAVRQAAASPDAKVRAAPAASAPAGRGRGARS